MQQVFVSCFRAILQGIHKRILSGNSWVLVIATYAVGALLLKYFIDWSNVNEHIIKHINILQIKHPAVKQFFQYWRGDNYGLDTRDLNGNKTSKSASTFDPKKQPFYLLTGWGMLHILLYAVLGFLAPQLCWVGLIVSICWELFEFSGDHDYHDVMDIAWNSFGMLMGTQLRKWTCL
jgi:hypothetical protein